MGEKKGIIWVIVFAVIIAVVAAYFYFKHHENEVKGQRSPMNFNAIVSQSGEGDGSFETISAAIQAAPSHNTVPYYIRVSAGVYIEVVVVPLDKPNIVLVGDGAEVTKITGNRQSPQYPTSESATFTIFGDGFMAQDITFENTGGSEPIGVALLNSANYSTFYKCKFMGYHDTLYAKEGKHFYRECDIYGSVDFIFGFATAVFQKCNLYARENDYQKVSYIAQGRQSLAQQSAFTFQGCKFTLSPEVGPTTTTIAYLGRPWFPFSTVMVMESFLDSVVSPDGWEPWPDAPVSNAIFLEFNNWGPGADTSGRVHWPGYKVIYEAQEAVSYTASQLIQGDEWIPKTGVPYNSGFISQ